MTAQARYAELVRAFAEESGVSHVTGRKGFGSTGQLKVAGHIFAMLVREELVLKLPRDRVDELVKQGEGRNFDAGKGKPMREWLVLSPTSSRRWTPLAREAFDFVKEGD